VESAQIVRSVPGFDEAALAAAREWEYEVTRVEGKPVKVRLTVPITFSLRLPEMTRQEGIPELRQGAAPVTPPGAPTKSATVTAEVTLAPDGRVADAQVKTGESPWAEALLQALRTWRFSPEGEGVAVSFRVRAEFVTPARGGAPRVELSLDGLRRSETPVAPAEATAPSPAPSPVASVPSAPSVPAAGTPASPPPASPAPASPAPTATPATPSAPPSPAAMPSPAAAPTPATAPPSPVPGAPASPMPAPTPGPKLSPSPAAAPSPSPAAGASPSPPPGPPIEIIRSPNAAPSAPPAPPVSAVRDVTLAMGIPDLSRGRRPVVPPIARIQQATGTVTVRFAVDAAGATSVQDVSGPDLLKEAARQTVLSWVFRRVTPDRLFMLAELKYGADTASASVRLTE
jgi:TonB family protein